MSGIFLSTLPLFLLIAAGALIRAVKLADERWTGVLNCYGLYIAFPALIIKSLAETSAPGPSDLMLLLVNIVLLNIALLLFYKLAKFFHADGPTAAALGICGFYGNVAYLGLPFIAAAMPGSAKPAILLVPTYLLVLFTTGIMLLEKLKGEHHHIGQILANTFKNPLMIAAIAGLIIQALHSTLPAPIGKTLSIAAASASPTVLVGLGVFLAQGIKINRDFALAGLLTALKILVLPFLFFAVWKIFGLNETFKVSILDAAMPVGLTSFALSQIYPVNKPMTAYAVILSTLISVITLPFLAKLLLNP